MNVTILGGGIGGLSSAVYLATRSKIHKINLFEATNRFSGWMRSESFDGYFFESAPRTLRPKGFSGNTTLELIELLGIENKIIPIKSDKVGGKFRLIWTTMSKKITAVTPEMDANLKVLFSSKITSDSESLHDFTSKTIRQEFADTVISPMVAGICAGDSKNISAKFLVKGDVPSEKFEPVKLYEKARNEKWSFYSIEGGLETLPKAIIDKLSGHENVQLNLNSRCQKIDFKPDGKVELVVNGETHVTSHVVSALPSHRLAPLLIDQHPEMGRLLNEMESADSVMVNLHFESEDLIKEQGFGVFVPTNEGASIIGIIFDGNCVKMKGTTLTVMMNGKVTERNLSNDEILELSQKYVKEILGISEKPDNHKVNILKQSFPQYTVGHYGRVEKLREYIASKNLPLSLCGQSFDGIGLNEVILSAKNASCQLRQ